MSSQRRIGGVRLIRGHPTSEHVTFSLVQTVIPSSAFAFNPALVEASLTLTPFHLAVGLVGSICRLHVRFSHLFTVNIAPV